MRPRKNELAQHDATALALGYNGKVRTLEVSSITKDAYDFYLSRRRYYDSDGNPFAEPAPLASNVRPGYGLFGGAADVTYRIQLP